MSTLSRMWNLASSYLTLGRGRSPLAIFKLVSKDPIHCWSTNVLPRSLLIAASPTLCLSGASRQVSATDMLIPASPQCQKPNAFGVRRAYSSHTQQQSHIILASSNEKMLDLVWLSAAELQTLQTGGSLTSTELAKLCLQQIEKI